MKWADLQYVALFVPVWCWEEDDCAVEALFWRKRTLFWKRVMTAFPALGSVQCHSMPVSGDRLTVTLFSVSRLKLYNEIIQWHSILQEMCRKWYGCGKRLWLTCCEALWLILFICSILVWLSLGQTLRSCRSWLLQWWPWLKCYVCNVAANVSVSFNQYEAEETYYVSA